MKINYIIIIMNNIENESTFFVSIERRKINNNSNFKNQKQNNFVQQILMNIITQIFK